MILKNGLFAYNNNQMEYEDFSIYFYIYSNMLNTLPEVVFQKTTLLFLAKQNITKVSRIYCHFFGGNHGWVG